MIERSNKHYRTGSIVLLFALIALTLLLPIASNTAIPVLPDYQNHLAAIVDAKSALAEGQFPLRVAPFANHGWRYPLYQFYSTTSYMVAGFIYQWFTPSNPFLAYKMTLWLAMMLGGIYLYLLAKSLVHSRAAAVLSSVVFMTSPYQWVMIDHLGSFNEAIAINLLPVVLYYTLQYYLFPSQLKNMLLTALSWYVLATVHLITFICSSFFIALFLLLLSLKRREFKNIFAVGIAYFFACLLSMWYLAPILMFSKYLKIYTGFDAAETYLCRLPFKHLISFIPDCNVVVSAGVNKNILQVFTLELVPGVGLPILAAIFVCLYAFILRPTLQNRLNRPLIAALLVVLIASFIIVWSPINFWRMLPPSMMFMQFGYRLLGQIMWTGAILFAFAVCWIANNQLHWKHSVVGLIIILLSMSAWFSVPKTKQLEMNALMQQQHLQSNADDYSLSARQYPFYNLVDSVQLDKFISTHQVALTVAHPISKSMLNVALKPFIKMEGRIPAFHYQPDQSLAALMDGKVIATYPLKSGVFDWTIPLDHLQNASNQLTPFTLQFALTPMNHAAPITIDADQLYLGGFLDSEKVITIDQLQPFCHQHQAITMCDIDVPAGIQYIELPMLYYPGMLDITLNGKPVNYLSMLYRTNLIATIIPASGQINHIRMQFRGMLLPNFISRVAWGVWLLLAIYSLFLFRSSVTE